MQESCALPPLSRKGVLRAGSKLGCTRCSSVPIALDERVTSVIFADFVPNKSAVAKEKRDRRLLAIKHKRNPSTTSSFHRQPMICHQHAVLTSKTTPERTPGAASVSSSWWAALRRRRSPWWTRRKTCTLTGTFFSLWWWCHGLH